MNLIIDIGNTACKLAIYDDNKLIYSDITQSNPDDASAAIAKTLSLYNAENCIASSVAMPYSAISAALKGKLKTAIMLGADTPTPLKNRYTTPHTLGNDRLAAAVGATVLFPGSDSLIIDAGTAITYDYVRNGAEYMGGNISPGVQLRLKALHDYTSRLPLITDPKTTGTFGTSTEEAISNGVMVGIIHEIEGYITDFEKKNVNSKIILTGGGSIYLYKKLKITIFAEPNLVTIGLNRILNYNVFKEY